MQQLATADVRPEEQTGSVVDSSAATTTMGKVTLVLEKDAVHAGTNLKGYVSIWSAKSDVEEVSLKIQGTGTIRLCADNGKTYSSHEDYLNDKMTVWTRSSKSEPNKGVELRAPFEYHIAKDAQPSFDGHYAKIVYTCIAVVKYTAALSRKQNSRCKFFVLPALDHTSVDESNNQHKINKRKSFTSFGINDGSVEVEMEVDKAGVQRNDTVGVVVSVKNESSLYLRSLKFGITQIVKSGVKGRQIIEKNPIVEFDESFLLKPKQTWRGRRMCSIDESLQPTLETLGDKIICQVSYLFYVSVVPPNFARSCDLTFPLHVY